MRERGRVGQGGREESGVPEAASLSYDLFKDCDSSEKLAAVLYGSRPNVVLVGEMDEYDKIQNAIKRLLADLPMLGRFVAILLEPVSDDDDKPSFLNRALALNSEGGRGREGGREGDPSVGGSKGLSLLGLSGMGI